MPLPNTPELQEMLRQSVAKMSNEQLVAIYRAMWDAQQRFMRDVVAIPCDKPEPHDK